MINLKTETIFPISEAPKHYPGTRPHQATAIRHALRGVNGTLLESLMVGGRRVTSVEAIHRFVIALNSPERSQKRSISSDDNSVDQQLDAAGF